MAGFVALALVVTPLAAIDALGADSPLQNWAASIVRYLGLAASVSLLYLFPDGRFIPPWTRGLAFVWALLNLPAVFLSGAPFSFTTWPRPLQIVTLLGWSASGVYAQVYRYFRVSTPQERQQTRWAILGLTAAVLGPFGYYTHFLTLPSLSQAGTPTIFYNLADPNLFRFAFVSQLAGVTSYTFGLLIFPLSLAIAVLRYQLFDIEIVVNRTLVYAGLTALVVGFYVLVVGALGSLLQAQGNVALAILATGLIAVLFNPLRQRLQRAVNRLMYGERDDPATVLSRLGERLGATAVPGEILPAIVETIAQTLRLPYVAVAVRQDGEMRVVASTGTARELPVESLPLVYHAETIGQLLVAPRALGEVFTTAERRLLENVARQAGTAVYAAQLTAWLQHSREQLVVAREEERRRLRRDLHDGLGPQLATLPLKLDAARNQIRYDPETAEQLLAELKAQTQAAIADVRRLVYDLRPPALDQLGLAPALREYAATHTGSNGLQITIEAPATMPALPAAVEVAAYRIALEAVTNVVRHAGASHCTVRLMVSDGLRLEIEDDGRGLPLQPGTGVGLASMRERAAELGGRLIVKSRPGGGVAVSVHLPFTPVS
ncbi:MAG: sensor histidine kinase [Chloroflexi bacterium]|nr:sensor histidine kinase [Chloroflexota bacterium]MCI0579884.1 sensor histidine kinase [Chloroflexota bacterium]MCI0646165.1 sensor histidine kinase [Chloroflexota bacterium]MCI0729875.1 sensor histidine kinase [Chloroflexota bacterium]